VLALEDCIGMCGLTEEEVLAVALERWAVLGKVVEDVLPTTYVYVWVNPYRHKRGNGWWGLPLSLMATN
jgi:hypothetical protein